MPERPKQIDAIIRKYTKHNVPDFFKYAKDKEQWQVELPNDSTMNRISKAIPDSRVKYNKVIRKFDWRVLTDGGEYTVNEDAPVIKSYNYWVRHQHQFNEENDNVKGADTYAAMMMRERILADGGADLSYVVNSLVVYLYTVKEASNKKLLWDCFGWDIVNNIRVNVADLGKICPICGRRFNPAVHNQVCCSPECAHTADVQNKRLARETVKPIVAEPIENTQNLVCNNGCET